MKRTLIALMTLALLIAVGMAGNTSAQTSTVRTIGIVTYQYEATSIGTDFLGGLLESDLAVLPPPENYNQGTALPLPPSQITFKVEARSADTPADQADAIKELLGLGVNGLIVAPVADDVEIRTALEPALLKNIPIMIVFRPLTGFAGVKFAGLESFRVASGWSSGASSGRNFVMFASDMDDPRQSELARGFAAKQPTLFMDTVIADVDSVYSAATGVLAASTDPNRPTINYVIVADPALTAGVVEAVKLLTTGTDRLIKVGVYGVPQNKDVLWTEKTIHMIASQDHYNMFLEAALQIKMLLVASVELKDVYVPVSVWTGTTAHNFMSYPYDYKSQLGFTFDRFWR